MDGCRNLGLVPVFTVKEIPEPEVASKQWDMPEYYANLDLDLYNFLFLTFL
jgi:hypothetical protein